MTIRLISQSCHQILVALQKCDWDASERGDLGTPESWETAGEEFRAATHEAQEAIDADAGTIDGAALADAMESMSGTEGKWGDDPETQDVERVIRAALGWEHRGRALYAALRSGE